MRGLLLGLLVVVIAAGAAFWWFVLRDDAPERAALGDCAAPTNAAAVDTVDGVWRVQADDPESVFVGYRIDERFGGETISKEAAGRTGDIEGDLAIDGSTVTDASIVAQLDSLTSNRTARDTALRTKGLETETFPEAKFTLAEAIELPDVAEVGVPTEANATGTLELHGTERDVIIPIDACWTGPTIRLSGSAPIILADYGIPQIETPIVDIDDRGELEFELTFVPG